MRHMVPITPTWAVSYFVHAQMFFNRKCKHFYDIWFPLLERGQFHLSCMSRTLFGHVSAVHVYYMAMKKVRVHSRILWHMVPITQTWALSTFVQDHMSRTQVLQLYHYNVLSCLLTISFFVHEQMFFNQKCKHRSRIIYLVYIHTAMKKARAHIHMTWAVDLSCMLICDVSV